MRIELDDDSVEDACKFAVILGPVLDRYAFIKLVMEVVALLVCPRCVEAIAESALR